MPVEWAISLRYFLSRRQAGALSFITGVAILGVTLGVGALVVAMAVMNGYQANLLRAMAGSLPHVSIHTSASGGGLEQARAIAAKLPPELKPRSESPFLSAEALVRKADTPDAPLQGVMLRGVDPLAEIREPTFLAFMDDGSPEWKTLPEAERRTRGQALAERLGKLQPGGEVPILLARVLATKLDVKIGDRLVPMSFPKTGGSFSPVPGATRLIVAGYFNTGILAFDELVVMAHIDGVARALPGEKPDTALGLRLNDPLSAATVASALRATTLGELSGVYVYSWLESNRGLFQVIRIQKVMLFLVLMLIVIIAFFGMISALVMLVTEKTREITILKSLGMPEPRLRRVFLLQGLLIGLLGTVFGVLLGLLVCWVLSAFPIIRIPAGVYPGSDRVPVLVSMVDVALIALGS
ncbi:MAG TPA: FtsX-like permease family protein, partial [bacterium]